MQNWARSQPLYGPIHHSLPKCGSPKRRCSKVGLLPAGAARLRVGQPWQPRKGKGFKSAFASTILSPISSHALESKWQRLCVPSFKRNERRLCISVFSIECFSALTDRCKKKVQCFASQFTANPTASPCAKACWSTYWAISHLLLCSSHKKRFASCLLSGSCMMPDKLPHTICKLYQTLSDIIRLHPIFTGSKRSGWDPCDRRAKRKAKRNARVKFRREKYDTCKKS